MLLRNIFLLMSLLVMSLKSDGQKHILDSTIHHIRNGQTREWSEFPVIAKEKELTLHFSYQKNDTDYTLYLRQYDVKQNWRVLINDHDIGGLTTDEKDMITYFTIPGGTLLEGINVFQLKTKDADSDDIKVGHIILDNRTLSDVLSEAAMDISVINEENGQLLPARITILNADRILQPVAASPTEFLAVRSGCIYTGNGKASLKLPEGTYTIFAGRGFEYGIDSMKVELKAGDNIQKNLRIKREVNTEGWISSDTHIHTYTYSRHGDATTEERALTIAGEGIELPILTDHNIHVDLKPVAKDKKVLPYFTPVVGDELTTKVGHFNVFQTTVGNPGINHQVEDWNAVSTNVQNAGNTMAVILNHARDIHNDFRPFDPSHHVSSAGIYTNDWKFPANAMEVINSGSQQTDIIQLVQDWFGMLNRGYFLTPVGSSDSHDVNRYIVGQGRTYIQSRDIDPANINVDEAIKNFREGRVMVSLGLLTKIKIDSTYGPGDVVSASGKVNVDVEVLGPAWANANRVSLYANGKKIREEKINTPSKAGSKWKGSWTIPLAKHDIFLVAIAEGPGEGMPYWPIAKPYQPASPEWRPHLMGITGAVWIDADKNGKRNSAYDYAKQIMESSKGDIHKVIKKLVSYDEAVAIQVAVLLWESGRALSEPEIENALRNSAPSTKAGFATAIKELAMIKSK